MRRARLLYLGRHGETDWNLEGRWQGGTDVALNERGRDQARDLADRLRHHPIGAVASSHLSRARETAEIAAEILGVPFVGAHAGLRERSYGLLEGRTREESMAMHPEVWKHHVPGTLLEAPGAEPHVQVATRMHETLESLTLAHADDDRALLVISHGGSMRLFLDRTLGRLVPPVPNVGIYLVPHDGERFTAASLLDEQEE